MRRKRCWGLSSCCDRQRSDSAQMMINEKANQPQTKCQKCKSCMCAPFSWMCRPCKRRKMDEVDMKKKKMKSELSWWERICCCSGCCKRCTKKGREERMKKVGKAHEQSCKKFIKNHLKLCYACAISFAYLDQVFHSISLHYLTWCWGRQIFFKFIFIKLIFLVDF